MTFSSQLTADYYHGISVQVSSCLLLQTISIVSSTAWYNDSVCVFIPACWQQTISVVAKGLPKLCMAGSC